MSNLNSWSLKKVLSFFHSKSFKDTSPKLYDKKSFLRSEIPSLASKYGFLKKPSSQKVISFYTAKGGVLKTTLAYEFSTILALNGIKVISIGLDLQCSLTDLFFPFQDNPDSIESFQRPLGLYQYLYENVSLKDIIKKTELPTLDVIPETPDLNILEKKLRDSKRREYVFSNKVINLLDSYDVIIFDNSPSWNLLIENSLTCSNNIISPIGCEIGTYQSLQTNLNVLWDFKQEMDIEWDNFFLIPTMLDNTKLSKQIYDFYKDQFSNYLLPFPIKRSIVGQESILSGVSVLEYDNSSSLSSCYRSLMTNLWKKVLSSKSEIEPNSNIISETV